MSRMGLMSPIRHRPYVSCERAPQNLIWLEPATSWRRPAPVDPGTLEEGLRALDMNRLELFGVKTEQLQNSRGDLRCLYRRRDIQAAGRSGPRHEDGNVSILGMITTVLGDLGLMGGIDDPVLSDADHVRYPGITLRDPDELRRGHARVYLPKTRRLDGLAVDARRGIVVVNKELPRKIGGRGGLIVEPEDHAVIVDPKRYQGFRVRISILVGAVPRSVESGGNFAVVDPVEGSEIHWRLPVFGRHDDRGAVEKSLAPESAHHLAKGSVNEVERVGQDRPGSSTIGKITAVCGPRQVALRFGSWQLLACRNCLEIHSKDRRRPWVTGAIVATAIDPVDDGLNLVGVVLLSQKVVRCPVGLGRVSWCRRARAAVDLGRKEIINAFAGRPGQGQVGGMLVRPRGQQMVLVSYLENGVYVQILIGIDRLAGRGIDGQVRWIDYFHRVARHVQNVFPRIRVALSWDDALTRVERA